MNKITRPVVTGFALTMPYIGSCFLAKILSALYRCDKIVLIHTSAILMFIAVNLIGIKDGIKTQNRDLNFFRLSVFIVFDLVPCFIKNNWASLLAFTHLRSLFLPLFKGRPMRRGEAFFLLIDPKGGDVNALIMMIGYRVERHALRS